MIVSASNGCSLHGCLQQRPVRGQAGFVSPSQQHAASLHCTQPSHHHDIQQLTDKHPASTLPATTPTTTTSSHLHHHRPTPSLCMDVRNPLTLSQMTSQRPSTFSPNTLHRLGDRFARVEQALDEKIKRKLHKTIDWMKDKLHVSHPAQQQKASSTTYHAGHSAVPRFTSVQHVLAWHVTEGGHRDQPALLYGSVEGKYSSPLTYNELDSVTNRLAAHFETELGRRSCRMSTQTSVICGLYGNSSPAFLFTQLAALKLNPKYIPFLLSPRNSPAALQNLCKTAGVSVILRGHETSFVAVTDEMLESKSIEHVLSMPTMKDIQLIIDDVRSAERHLKADMLAGEEMKRGESESKHAEEEEKVQEESKSEERTKTQQVNELDPEATALILHSSGSTQAYPKVIKLPNRYVNALLNEATQWGLKEADVAYLTAPLFHAYGVFVLLGTLRTATTLVLPAVKVWPPTTDMLLGNIKQSRATVLYMLPWLLENMAMEAEDQGNKTVFDTFKSMREVVYGGAGVSPHVGNKLFAQGVPLVNIWGSSEAGWVAAGVHNRRNGTYKPCTGKDAYAHVQLLPSVKLRLQPHTDGGSTSQFEVIILKDNPTLALDQRNTDTGDFNMNDVIERVECVDDRECYVILGRVDDVIVHSTGEKTNPLPMEAAIRKECHAVEAAVVGGNGRFNCYALIELKQGFQRDDTTVEQVWQAVRRANEDAPSHSRVLREMFIILPEGEIIPRTDKGSNKRKVAEVKYKEQVDRLYAGFVSAIGKADNVSASPKAVKFDSEQDLRKWLQTTIRSMLVSYYGADDKRATADIPRNTSIFDLGFDSLLATQLYYHHLKPALPHLQLQPNIVYLYSTIDALSDKLWKLYTGAEHLGCDDVDHEVTYQHSEALYHKYTSLMSAIEDRKSVSRLTLEYHTPTEGENVVVTGCTGSLGSFLIRDLLHNPKVKHVYALVRGSSSKSDNERQKLIAAMEERAINTKECITEGNLTVWPCDLTADHLGLSTKQYTEICNNASSIIHNAWMLNFNRGVLDFDASCIRPSYDLLRIASTKRLKQFYFVSSITAAINGVDASTKSVPEKPMTDQHAASSIGYGQSKLVTERIATEYGKRFNVPVTIARVGQVAGDSINGVWNTSEHISLMIQAATIMGVMPDRYMGVDYLPVDVVAQTFVHLLTDCPPPNASTHNSGVAYTRVIHMTNPVHLPWLEFLRTLQSPSVKFPRFRIVEPRVWLQELSKPEYSDPETNPIVKLRPYWEGVFGEVEGGKESGLEVDFDTKQTLALAPHMHYVLDQVFWSKVVQRWRASNFIKV